MSRTDDFVYTRYRDLIGLLVAWHRLDDIAPVAGYPPECPSCMDYRTSRQYDDTNGAQETSARTYMAQRVGREVDAMAEPHRTALYVLARNRSTGVMVWASPRLPADNEDRAALVADALARLSERI
jgi:hypothetical protein